jgi:hypothetical protein
MKRAIFAILAIFLSAVAYAEDIPVNSGTIMLSGDEIILSTAPGQIIISGVRSIEFSANGNHPDFPDMRLDMNHNRHWLQARTLELSDKGDPVDLVLQRAGPDNALYGDPPAPLAPGAAIASIRFRAMGDNGHYWPGPSAVDMGQGSVATIYVRAIEAQTDTSRAGDLYFATTPAGAIVQQDRLRILNTGRIQIWHPERGGLADIRTGPVNSCGYGWRCLIIPN